ncbi:hypothetical protein ACFWNT_11145 [Streptomyces sp. NPDC058409]
MVGRMGAVVDKGNVEERKSKASVIERFDYRFEQPQTPEGGESEYGE